MADKYIDPLGLSALKSWIMSKIPIVDSSMSDSSENAVQNKVVKAYVDSMNGGAFASMFSIGLADSYMVEVEEDAPAVLSSALNLDGFVAPVGTSGIVWKKPSVIVPPVQWTTTVDDDYNYTGSVDVKVQFGEAGYLTKNVTFKRPGDGKLYACMMSDSTAHIETGIDAMYEYKYHAKGHPIPSQQCVLVDAYLSNTARATIRMLSGSNKFQVMWAANREVLGSSIGMTIGKMFELTVGANYLQVTQGAQTVTPTITGHTDSGAVGTTIRLMNSASGNLGSAILSFAEIIDGDGQTIAKYEPYRLQGSEVVLLNTNGLAAQQIFDIVQNSDDSQYASGRIFRPTSGYLIEVTRAEDEM